MKWEFDHNNLQAFLPILSRLEEKKQRLVKARPLPGIVLQKIKEELFLEWTYNSNSIEGNTLNLNETRIVLQDGMTIKGKSLKEHFEIVNHHEAIDYLMDLIRPSYTLSEKDILVLHDMVLSKIEKDFCGRYRNGGVRIAGANFLPPNALKVGQYMEELILWTNTNPMNLHIILLSAVFHHRFVHIHPFFDGNGRTVRLVMNLLLLKEGFPPAIILKNDRKKYYEALNQANHGSYQKLFLLILQAVERSLNLYIQALPTEYPDDYEIISQLVQDPSVPYGQEYISLLARRGQIDAYKEGRSWLTKKSAIQSHWDKMNSEVLS